MHRTRIFRSRNLIATLVGGTLIIAVIVAQGVNVDSSATQLNLTRQPRPHPQSHLKSSEPDSITLNPRPHPKSHIRSTVTETLLNQP